MDIRDTLLTFVLVGSATGDRLFDCMQSEGSVITITSCKVHYITGTPNYYRFTVMLNAATDDASYNLKF